MRKAFQRDRTGGQSVVDRATVWGGGVFAVGAIGIWVLSGRDPGWFDDAVLSGPWAVAIGLTSTAAALHGLTVVGPIGTDAATTFWLVSSPLDRWALLTSRILAWSAISVIAGIVTARAVTVVAHASTWWPFALIGAAAGLFVIGTAVLAQRYRPARRALPFIEVILVGTGAAVWFAGVSVSAKLLVPAAVVVTAVAVTVWALALAMSDRITRAALTSAAPMVAAGATALSFFDPSLVSAGLEHRAYLRRGAVRSKNLPRSPAPALVAADMLRHWRNRNLAIVVTLSMLVVLAAGSALPPLLAELVALAVSYWVVSSASVGLRDIYHSNALRSMLGLPDRTIVLSHLVLPAAVAFGVSVVVALTMGPVTALIVGITSAAGVYRSRTKPPLDYGGLSVITMFGSIPIDLIRQLWRGPGMVGLGALALVLI